MSLKLIFSKADNKDAEQIVDLINSAYRGVFSRNGWTTEADFLNGRRTDLEEILSLIANEHSEIIVCKNTIDLLGSVHLQAKSESVHISMLVVCPTLQNLGIGKKLLQAAEIAAQENWAANRLVMEVITLRQELIAFYERCGYQRTGITRPFPVNPLLWTPTVSNLCLELLEKLL